MNGSPSEDCSTRTTNTIQQNDVAQSNRNLNSSTRGSCTSDRTKAGSGGGGDDGGGGGGDGGEGCDPILIELCQASGGIFDPNTCACLPPEEEGIIVVDTEGDGVELTDAVNGVEFDLNADGLKEQVSWTHKGSDDAILVIDRNKNGKFDGVWELAGHRLAIKKVINPDFLLWWDVNHNGVVEAGELRATPVSGISLARRAGKA